MAKVTCPKDLTNIQTKIIFNLTKRQLICFSSGSILGLFLYFTFKDILNKTVASSIMVIVMLPFFIFAMYQKDGLYIEKHLKNFLVYKFSNKIRVYKTNNFYRLLERSINEKEKK